MGFNPEILKKTPQVILGFLDTAGQALPDLVIRTGASEEELPIPVVLCLCRLPIQAGCFCPICFLILSQRHF